MGRPYVIGRQALAPVFLQNGLGLLICVPLQVDVGASQMEVYEMMVVGLGVRFNDLRPATLCYDERFRLASGAGVRMQHFSPQQAFVKHQRHGSIQKR